MNISDNLRQLRLQKGMTQEQVGSIVGLTRQAISGYESGRTRPDIETLLRLAQVYGTDLDGILYGQGRALQAYRRLRKMAMILGLMLIAGAVLRSGLLLGVNLLIPYRTAAYDQSLYGIRMNLLDAVNLLDGLQLLLANAGFIGLLILGFAGRCRISLKEKLCYPAAFCGILLLISAAFGFFDPIYQLVDYLLSPLNVTLHAGIFLLFGFAIEVIIRHNS